MMAKKTTKIYQLKVTLKGIRPPIWRRIQVKGNITLLQLHDILQVVMGWYDYHLAYISRSRRRFTGIRYMMNMMILLPWTNAITAWRS